MLEIRIPKRLLGTAAATATFLALTPTSAVANHGDGGAPSVMTDPDNTTQDVESIGLTSPDSSRRPLS